MHENIRVETFMSGLRHYRSHFLITDPSPMEEVKRIVQTITKNKQWNKSYLTSTLNESDESDEISDDEVNLKPSIKKKYQEISNPISFKAKEAKMRYLENQLKIMTLML